MPPPPLRPRPHVDVLEPRRLLAWGAYPHLIGQDLAAANYPAIDGAGALIVVIDSGVNAAHPNLSGHLWKNPGEVAGDGLDNDHDGYVDDVNGYDFVRNDGTPDDEAGHGSAVTGIIAASAFTYNNASYAGIARGAKIISLKVLDASGAYGSGTELRIERALRWVEALDKRYPVTAVNLSLRTPADVYAATYADEVARLAAAGVILSASGGQDDANADVHYPSLDPNVWATSIADESDRVSSIVNRGAHLDLLAPGVRVPVAVRGGTGFSSSGEGSSWAAPHVTAAAALVKQVWPKATAAQVLAVLKDSGRPVKDTSTRFTYSGGTYPRLNVDAAIRLAYQRRPAIFPAQTPFKGTPFAVGATIQAEDFDNGGEGVAYHDTDAANVGGSKYRATGVDMGAIAGGPTFVSYAHKGEWLEYTITVAKAGTYTLDVRVASPADGAAFHVEVDGVKRSGTVGIAKTASWRAYRTVSAAGINLPAGAHVMRVAFDANNALGFAGNFDWFSLAAQPVGVAAVKPPAVGALAAKREDAVWA